MKPTTALIFAMSMSALASTAVLANSVAEPVRFGASWSVDPDSQGNVTDLEVQRLLTRVDGNAL